MASSSLRQRLWQPNDFLQQQFVSSAKYGDDLTSISDEDGVPIRPDGDCIFKFEEASSKPNLYEHYSEWQWKCQRTGYRKMGEMPKAIKIIYKICTGIVQCSSP